MGWFWNGSNGLVHRLFVGGLVKKVNTFSKAGQVHVLSFLADPLHEIGLLGEGDKQKAKERMTLRARLGLHPIGLTAFVGMLFLLGFLLLA
jgi:hypothetical protein